MRSGVRPALSGVGLAKTAPETRIGMINTPYVGAGVVRYRWLLYELVLRDVRLRYRSSILGFTWTLLNPVVFMLLYALVFSVYLKIRIPNFPLYLLAGLIPWNWFAGALPAATTAIPDGRMYVGKTVFPIELLVLVPVLSNAVNFLLSLALLIPFVPLLGGHVSAAIVALPIVIVSELLLLAGFSFLLATFNTFYRDLQQLVTYFLSALFFLTPIFYTDDSVPHRLAFLVKYSPFAAMIHIYHDILYRGVFPSFRENAFVAGCSVIALLIGIACFDRYRDHFGDYV